MSNFKVYWIHREAHTDIEKEGYVGITRETVSRRYSRHLGAAKNNRHVNKHLQSAILAYDDIVVTTICICDKDYALLLENKLRPVKNIGWNIVVGGITNPYFSAPKKVKEKKPKPDISGPNHPNWQGGIKNWRKFYCLLSESPQAIKEKEIKKQQKLLHKKETRGKLSLEHVEKLSLAKKEMYENGGPWLNSQADKYLWRKAQDVYLLWVSSPCGDRALCRKLGIFRTQTIINMIEKFRDGWIPAQDTRFLEFVNESQTAT